MLPEAQLGADPGTNIRPRATREASGNTEVSRGTYRVLGTWELRVTGSSGCVWGCPRPEDPRKEMCAH